MILEIAFKMNDIKHQVTLSRHARTLVLVNPAKTLLMC